MNDSKGSAVIVGDQGPQYGLPDLGVVPDDRGESGEALEDPGEDALIGPPTVAFQVELALQGVVHRFDELAQRLQERTAGSALLIGASRTDERGAVIGEEGLELGRGVALVPHDLLAGTAGKEVRIDLEHVPGHLALI